MPHIKWSEGALKDIQRLYRFLAPKNPNAAAKAIKAIRAGVRILSEMPMAGKVPIDFDENYREWPINFGDQGYVVIYRIAGAEIVIVHVYHGREDRS